MRVQRNASCWLCSLCESKETQRECKCWYYGFAQRMSKAKSIQDASPDAEGIGGEADGFARLASLKKRSGNASAGTDSFVQIVNEKKHIRSANVGKHDGFAPNTQVTGPTIEISDQRMSKVRSLQAASPNAEGISDKAAGLNQIASSKKRSRDANAGTDGFAQIVNQKKQNRSANVSKHGVFAPNSLVTKLTIGKADQNISKARSLQDASPDALCIGDEAADLAQLASLKKHSGNASAGSDGFAQVNNEPLL
ncbi:hypothetical protein POM88_034072 [Heracleum sosnowskyi]|uniref:Uncharacterized protein n=1 Tax=Heracleum sosnowskyi TaxID=360622 RepID=A0AAD8MA80_9APIA|nr:hypothetical protein POM88_034072 [Heracleum sosnowskyi]